MRIESNFISLQPEGYFRTAKFDFTLNKYKKIISFWAARRCAPHKNLICKYLWIFLITFANYKVGPFSDFIHFGMFFISYVNILLIFISSFKFSNFGNCRAGGGQALLQILPSRNKTFSFQMPLNSFCSLRFWNPPSAHSGYLYYIDGYKKWNRSSQTTVIDIKTTALKNAIEWHWSHTWE